MKIVHVALGGCLRGPPVAYGITADTGGHIAYVLAAAAAQAAQNAATEVTIVTRRFDGAMLGDVYGRAVERVSARVRIARIATSDVRYLEKDALAAELPLFIERFLAWLDREPPLPSIIHAHFADAAAVALAARETFGIPFVYTPHALGLDKAAICGAGAQVSARIRAERKAIAEADAIIVSSEDEAKHQLSAYNVPAFEQRTHVMRPGVPPLVNGSAIMAPLAFHDASRPLMLAIARPTSKKNLVAVAEAYAGSRLRETTNLAILAGQHEPSMRDEEEREVLVRLREILCVPALAGRVALPRRHGSTDVAALYHLAARSGGVFVSPALHEPFGLTLLEAAAAGLPVVATVHGGAADIVRLVGHGLTVDPRDRAAIAAACLRIIEDWPLRRRLLEASAGCAKLFSWERYGRRSTRLYTVLAEAAAREDAAAA